MKRPGNLSDMTERVNLYLDRALPKEAEENLLRDVDDDPRYRTVLDNEKNFREFIKSHVHRSNVSADLIRSIKDKIKIA